MAGGAGGGGGGGRAGGGGGTGSSPYFVLAFNADEFSSNRYRSIAPDFNCTSRVLSFLYSKLLIAGLRVRNSFVSLLSSISIIFGSEGFFNFFVGSGTADGGGGGGGDASLSSVCALMPVPANTIKEATKIFLIIKLVWE